MVPQTSEPVELSQETQAIKSWGKCNLDLNKEYWRNPIVISGLYLYIKKIDSELEQVANMAQSAVEIWTNQAQVKKGYPNPNCEEGLSKPLL